MNRTNKNAMGMAIVLSIGMLMPVASRPAEFEKLFAEYGSHAIKALITLVIATGLKDLWDNSKPFNKDFNEAKQLAEIIKMPLSDAQKQIAEAKLKECVKRMIEPKVSIEPVTEVR